MKAAIPMRDRAQHLHYHILPTPIIARRRYAARDLMRAIERDVIRGKDKALLAALSGKTMQIAECVNPACLAEAKP